MFLAIYHDTTGLIHLLTASIALLTGTMILFGRKGSRQHVRIGYIYTVSMVVMLATAFALYHLFGSFGIFHVLAVVSTITLAGGMLPFYVWGKTTKAMQFHFSFMYWSVIGLYAAFAAETLVRLQLVPFFWMVGAASGAVAMVGSIFFRKYKEHWSEVYAYPLEKKAIPPVPPAQEGLGSS